MQPWSLGAKRRWAAHVFTLIALAGWAIAAAGMPAYLLPSPLTVLARVSDFFLQLDLFVHVVASVTHVVVSLALAFVLGGTLALLAHYLPVTRRLVDGRITPFFNAFSGIGWLFLIILPICVINLRAGLESLDAELAEMGRSFGRDWGKSFRLIVLPAMIPFMFATLRISFGVAWKVALTAELFGGNSGLGFIVNLARQSFNTGQIFAVVAIIVIIYVTTDNWVLDPVQRRLSKQYADE